MEKTAIPQGRKNSLAVILFSVCTHLNSWREAWVENHHFWWWLFRLLFSSVFWNCCSLVSIFAFLFYFFCFSNEKLWILLLPRQREYSWLSEIIFHLNTDFLNIQNYYFAYHSSDVTLMDIWKCAKCPLRWWGVGSYCVLNIYHYWIFTEKRKKRRFYAEYTETSFKQ